MCLRSKLGTEHSASHFFDTDNRQSSGRYRVAFPRRYLHSRPATAYGDNIDVVWQDCESYLKSVDADVLVIERIGVCASSSKRNSDQQTNSESYLKSVNAEDPTMRNEIDCENILRSNESDILVMDEVFGGDKYQKNAFAEIPAGRQLVCSSEN